MDKKPAAIVYKRILSIDEFMLTLIKLLVVSFKTGQYKVCKRND